MRDRAEIARLTGRRTEADRAFRAAAIDGPEGAMRLEFATSLRGWEKAELHQTLRSAGK